MLITHAELEVVPGRKVAGRDVEVYLLALDSYAEQAAQNPKLTFEEHYRIVAGRPELRLEPMRHEHAAGR